MFYKKIIFLLLLLIFVQKGFSEETNLSISLDLQNVTLADAIHQLAREMQLNIVLNPGLTDVVSLHLHHVSAEDALAMLLRSHDLIKIRLRQAWYIVPRKVWLQQTEDEVRLQEVMDNSALLQTQIWQLHYAKAEDIARMIQENNNSLLSKRGHVRIDARTNILCVQDTAMHLNSIRTLIKKTDVPVSQILISTRLASVDSHFERTLGIRFNVIAPGVTPAIPGQYSLLVAELPDGSILDPQLSALENSGHAELISSPELFTANQQSAMIESGEEIPYQEVSLSGGTAVTFKKAVLSLKVTPQILPHHKILLQLQINQDKPSKLFVQGQPVINTREITTNVLVRDGKTIVLGGIYESDKEDAKESIPFLAKIPLFGLLFQDRDNNLSKRELLIFVTPKIIPEEVT